MILTRPVISQPGVSLDEEAVSTSACHSTAIRSKTSTLPS